MERSEKPSEIPVEERLRVAIQTQAEPLAQHLCELGEPYWDPFEKLLLGVASNGVQLFWGTKRYDQDMEAAGRNAINRPFGIEMSTLSPNIQVVLHPKTIYKADTELKQIAKEEGYKIRESGTQVMVYFLDDFEEEEANIPNLAANFLFIAHMAEACLNTSYPLQQGEKSPEFLQEVREALNTIGKYVAALSEEQKSHLSVDIEKIGTFTNDELNLKAQRFVLYSAEPIKMSGLYESDNINTPQETPEQTIQNGTLYLQLNDRNLPQRINDKKVEDVPSEPWVEYGKNRWNRSCQLFGRYETSLEDERLRLDFRLDSTHMPALYGFFDTLEITRVAGQTIREHIIFGQEMGKKADLIFLQFFGAKLNFEQLQDSVIPVIVAGEFDFKNQNTRELLERLVQDKGTKPDISRVVADILRLSAQDKLQRVQQIEKEDYGS